MAEGERRPRQDGRRLQERDAHREEASPVQQPPLEPQHSSTVAQVPVTPQRRDAVQARQASRPSCQVEVGGDAYQVWLVGNGAAPIPVPGRVFAGSYDIQAQFGAGDEPIGAGRISVDGEDVSIHCNARFQRCKAR